jgi:DNA-binding response OmpR family regulator
VTAPGSARGVVLVVEDEQAIADLLARYLRREGYEVHHETDGAAALRAVRRVRPSAVVLDIGLPSLDGLQLCRELRAAGDTTPIVFVSARDEDVDRILGLELGGDDYVTKPFSPREVVVRVNNVLRRAAAAGPQSLRMGAVELDVSRRRVRVNGKDLELTATEFDLLRHLMRSQGQVFSREQLLSAVWGYTSAAGTRTVDVHVAQLRAKLGPASPIRTVRGVGYAADDNVGD